MMIPREFERYNENGRYQRTRPANSRPHRDLRRRPFGSAWQAGHVPHLVYGHRDGSPSRPPSRDSIAQLEDITAKPISPASHETTKEAFVLTANIIKRFASSGVALLKPPRSHSYNEWFLPFLVFNELDRKLFRSKLKGNVCLEWSRLYDSVPGRTTRAGLKHPRITIELSEKLADTNEEGVVTALLHQMIHAYYLQCCGYQSEGLTRTGYDLAHGPEFLALKALIDYCYFQKSRGPGSPPLYSWNPLDIPMLSGRGRRPFGYPEYRPGSSDCCGTDGPLRKGQYMKVKLWIDRAAASSFFSESTTTVPDKGNKPIEYGSQASKGSGARKFYAIEQGESEPSSAPSKYQNMKPEDYIELHFDKRIYPLERKYTNDLLELSKCGYFTNKREFHFPSTFGWSEFRSLYHFLVYRDFEPTLASIQADSLSKDYKPGLPIILTRKDSSQQYLSTSIAAALLGSALKFTPLTTHAIYRLKNLGWTTNNPIRALSQIYHGPDSPNSDLRGWVKSWLAVRLPTSPDAAYAKAYPTNLAVLKSHPEWKKEFAALQEKEKDKKKELNSDIEAAEKQIVEAAAKAASEAASKEAAAKEAASKAAASKEAASKIVDANCSPQASGQPCHPCMPQHHCQQIPLHSPMGPYRSPSMNTTPRPSAAAPFAPGPTTGYPNWPSTGPYGCTSPRGSNQTCSCGRCQGYPQDTRQGWGWHP